MTFKALWLPGAYQFWQFQRGRTFYYDPETNIAYSQGYIWLRVPYVAVRFGFKPQRVNR